VSDGTDHAAGGRAPARHDVRALTERVEAALARLDGQDLAEHPAAFEAMDAAIRATLGAGTPG
jgi:hypothetical protein